jgi:hypothetical protein
MSCCVSYSLGLLQTWSAVDGRHSASSSAIAAIVVSRARPSESLVSNRLHAVLCPACLQGRDAGDVAVCVRARCGSVFAFMRQTKCETLFTCIVRVWGSMRLCVSVLVSVFVISKLGGVSPLGRRDVIAMHLMRLCAGLAPIIRTENSVSLNGACLGDR